MSFTLLQPTQLSWVPGSASLAGEGRAKPAQKSTSLINVAIQGKINNTFTMCKVAPSDWTVSALHMSWSLVLLNVIFKKLCVWHGNRTFWSDYGDTECLYRVTHVDERLRIRLWMVCMCLSCWSCTSQTFLLFITSVIVCLWCSFSPLYPNTSKLYGHERNLKFPKTYEMVSFHR